MIATVYGLFLPKAKIAEQVPLLRPKNNGRLLSAVIFLLLDLGDARVARYSVAVKPLLTSPYLLLLPKRFYVVKDFWEEEKPTERCRFAKAKGGKGRL